MFPRCMECVAVMIGHSSTRTSSVRQFGVVQCEWARAARQRSLVQIVTVGQQNIKRNDVCHSV